MRQRLAVIVTIVLVLAVLILINAATYVSEDQRPESELSPNRSTYHSGATGTRALYDFLSESGYRVMRWRELPEKLLADDSQVRTFVIIGDTHLSIEEDQAESLLAWVKRGGRLILVDRTPNTKLLPASGNWTINSSPGLFPMFDDDPAVTEQMTENVNPVAPVQPTKLTHSVESVMPSRFAATINFFSQEKNEKTVANEENLESEFSEESEEEPHQAPTVIEATSEQAEVTSPAPVVHIGDASRALLVDYPHGQGRIVLLSDPYIFSNGGIRLADNLELAMNLVASTQQLTAFDEYHQGRGVTRNAFVGYFSGTPVLPILGQLLLLILLILWTQSRRFARPLPLAQVDRRSSLEFVASMAELQQRARAFDLAIENIYSRTRRVLARYAGMEYNSPRSEIAARVAARSTIEARSVEVLMRQCEDAINGAPVSERQTIQLIKRLRDLERTLGLRMRARDEKQAAQKV